MDVLQTLFYILHFHLTLVVVILPYHEVTKKTPELQTMIHISCIMFLSYGYTLSFKLLSYCWTFWSSLIWEKGITFAPLTYA